MPCKSVAKLGILYYYAVAEMHIFLSEVDLSRLAYHVYSSQSVDWQPFSLLVLLYDTLSGVN